MTFRIASMVAEYLRELDSRNGEGGGIYAGKKNKSSN
jgi:hypothetical protein